MTANLRGTVMAAALIVGAAFPAWAEGGWRSAKPMETARSNSAAAVIGTEIYVAGGASVLGPRDVFEVFDADGEYWRPMPALPDPRESFGMAAIGNKLYLAGGYKKESLEPTRDLWIYDLDADKWVKGASLPAGRAGLALVAVGSKLYALGGDGPNATRVFEYDPAGDAWKTASWSLPESRVDPAAVVAEGRYIYLLGGIAPSGPSKRADRVDVTNGAWKRLADMPMSRSSHTAALLGSVLHVTGGVSGKELKTFSDHHVFDISSGRWSSATPLPTPRRGMVSAVVNGRWYVIGGGSGAGFFTVFTEADAVEVYEP